MKIDEVGRGGIQVGQHGNRRGHVIQIMPDRVWFQVTVHQHFDDERRGVEGGHRECDDSHRLEFQRAKQGTVREDAEQPVQRGGAEDGETEDDEREHHQPGQRIASIYWQVSTRRPCRWPDRGRSARHRRVPRPQMSSPRRARVR